MHAVGDKVWVQRWNAYGVVLFTYPDVLNMIVVRRGAEPFVLSLSQVAK